MDAAGQDRPAQAAGAPDEVVQAARAAFSALDPGAGLAELVHDSLDRADEADAADDRRLAFRGGGYDVAVVVGEQSLAVSVTPSPEDLGVETRGASAGVPTADGPGRWTVAPAPRGPVSLVLTDGSRRVRTAWALL